MTGRIDRLILALALLAAIAGGFLQHSLQRPASVDSRMIGQPVPALTFQDLEGHPHAFKEFAGRRVVVNFWASWCVPCVQEMPALSKAQRDFGENAPIIVGIAMDDANDVRRFLAAHPVTYPIWLGDRAPPSTSLLLGDDGEVLPYSVLLSADGRILATHPGPLDEGLLRRWLDSGIRSD